MYFFPERLPERSEFARNLLIMNPVIASRQPMKVQVEAGKDYWWCACGRSANQPFCDGSHKGSGIAPKRYTAEKDGDVWFCQCKHTRNPPLCDGSHKQLPEDQPT